MSLRTKNRYTAFGIHFLISLFIAGIIAYLILAYWYPEPFFTAEGGWPIFRLIFIVHLVIGPVLTLIIYKPGKKGLKFDLSIIACFQFAALTYGVTVLYLERPEFLAFSIDRFVLVSSNDVDVSKLSDDQFWTKAQKKPITVYAHMPDDPDQRQDLLRDTLRGQPDLEFRAEYYEPFKKYKNKALAKSLDMNISRKLSKNDNNKIDRFITEHCHQDCAFFPLVGKKKDMVIVIRKDNLHVVGGIDVDPWAIIKEIKTAENREYTGNSQLKQP